MHRMRYARLTLGLLIGIVLGSRSSEAQYTASFQTNIISGVTNNWSGSYSVGGLGFSADVLLIQNGGVLSNGDGYVGYHGSNDTAVVTGSGSLWIDNGTLTVSWYGAGNSLVISNGGQVLDANCNLGFEGTSSNNSLLVTDPGSVLSNANSLSIGGRMNSLVINNGGKVVDNSALIGTSSLGRSNSVRVVNGGVWQNNLLYVGYWFSASNNMLMITGGSVFATNLIVGVRESLCDNLLQLDSGSVIVTNVSTNAELEVRYGKFILNGGTLQVDRFVMTNACAQFVRTGGTLIYSVAVLDPNRDDDGDGIPNGWEQSHGHDPLNAADANLDSDGDGFTNLQEYLAGTDPQDNGSAFRITSITQVDSNILVTWTMGSGKTNALQRTGGILGSYATNNFADIFIVTNTVGTVTNYLDIGGATNSPSRYYRVRLVP
jgi:T5SS/PEP-CTERM-associated repeat protein